MQATRRYKPATVSRRTSVVAGFFSTCVIDGILGILICRESDVRFAVTSTRSC